MQKKIKNVNQIKDILNNVFKNKKNIMKKDFYNNKIVKRKLGYRGTIQSFLKTHKLILDDIALEANIKFKTEGYWAGKHRSKETNKKIGCKNTKLKSINQMKDVMKDVFKYEGQILKKDFYDNKFVKEKLACKESIRSFLRKNHTTLDEIALELNIKFKKLKGLEKNLKIKNIKQIEDVLEDFCKYKGIQSKGDFFNNKIVKNRISCIKNKKDGVHGIIRHALNIKGLTIDDIAKKLNVQFKIPRKGIGTNEVQLLEEYMIEKNIQDVSSISQFIIAGKKVDKTVPSLKLFLEVDEQHHKYQQPQDRIREQLILSTPGYEEYKFVRIKDGW